MTDGLEQALAEEFSVAEDQENEDIQGQEVEESPQEDHQEQPEIDHEEQEARASGWRPKEEWQGDPKEWRDPKSYLIYRDFADKHKAQQDKINSMEREFNERTESLNRLHAASLKAQREQLEARRIEAVDNADTEEFSRVQKSIDELNTQEQAVVQPAYNQQAHPDQAIIENWNKSNPWVLGSDPKAAYAKQQFGAYQSQGYNAQQAIAAMESDVARAFPAVNQNRDNHPRPEGGTKPGAKAARSLSMSDLRSEEIRLYKSMPGAWGSEKEFLKSVMESRKGEK